MSFLCNIILSIVKFWFQSYETLASRASCGRGWVRGAGGVGVPGDEMQSEQPEVELLRTEQAVEAMLRRSKHCSKYLKDVITYAEKRAHLDLEYAKNLSKLAQTVKPLISEEVSVYCTHKNNNFNYIIFSHLVQ